MIDNNDDIVNRLRRGDGRCGYGTDFASCPDPACPECAIVEEAALEILRLRAENAALQPKYAIPSLARKDYFASTALTTADLGIDYEVFSEAALNRDRRDERG